MTRAESYAHWVLEPANEQKTGRLMKLAAKRFLSDLEREDLIFDQTEADKFTRFAETVCCLWEDKWRGEPVKIMPWMAFIFEQVYGWFYTETGLRRIRKVYVQVAKKNAKSSLCGVLANYHLFADQRVRTPKVFVGANNEDQAKICVNIAGKIIEQSPDLMEYVEEGLVDLFQYKENIVNILHRERDGFIKAMAKETESKTSKQAGGKHGFNPSLWIIDEYGMADSSMLLETLRTAQAAREEPLGFAITTAGHKINGPCYQQLRRTGVDVLERTIEDDGYLVIIHESDKGDSIYDESTWGKSNPNLGVSVFGEFLRDQVRDARNQGGSTEVNVRTLNFNEWCETPEVWIPKEVWAKNTHGIAPEELEGLPCYGALHIVSQRELGALVLVFPNFREDLHVVKPLFFMPQDSVIDNHMKMDFGRWVNEGFIKTCAGNVIDNEFIFNLILEEIQKYQMHSLAYPVNNEKHFVLQALVNEGIECNPISQGYRGNSEPSMAWEGFLNATQIEHFGHPVLAWSNSQCMTIRKGDDIRIERAGGKTAGIVACINAVAQWKTVESEPQQEFGIDFVNL